MATYTTPGEVRDKLIGSSQYPISGTGVGTAADITDAQITAEIDNAEAQINSVLARRYAVPFESGSVPTLVTQLTADIAAYLSDLSYRGGAGRQYDSRLNPLVLRYERASTFLTWLRDGEVDIPGEDELPPDGGSPGGLAVVNRYDGHLFDPEGYDVFGPADAAHEPVTTHPDGTRVTYAPEWWR